MADINKVWLSGRAVTQPILTKTAPRTPFAVFTLEVTEQFIDRDGTTRFKNNFVRIESLGKAAAMTMERVKEGGRYYVEGYLRIDRSDGGSEETKVRTFAVYKEDSDGARFYQSGVREALKIVEESRDKTAAIGRLRELLAPA